MQTILITGANGQLGQSIKKIARNYPDYKFFFTDVDELDITDKEAIKTFVHNNRITCIVNTAGYTAVDKAETDADRANLINGTAVAYLAIAAKNNDALLVHISTDYVFDGEHFRPISEEVIPKPLSVYATSKVKGEQAAMNNGARSVVVRTSWLYSEFGHNFVKTMLKYGRERESLKVVYDQVGTPTYAGDLAKTILDLIPKWQQLAKPEIFHYSNEGVASWYDFAVSIHRLAGIQCRIYPVETKDYPLPAKRPFFSVMSKDKIKTLYGISIPHWFESLRKCMEIIN